MDLLTSITGAIAYISLPATAEDYMNMCPQEKLLVKCKLGTMYTGRELIDMLVKYEKPLEKRYAIS